MIHNGGTVLYARIFADVEYIETRNAIQCWATSPIQPNDPKFIIPCDYNVMELKAQVESIVQFTGIPVDDSRIVWDTLVPLFAYARARRTTGTGSMHHTYGIHNGGHHHAGGSMHGAHHHH